MEDKRGFLWVNKTAASALLSRSGRSESQEILRFVQQHRSHDQRSRGSRGYTSRHDGQESPAGQTVGLEERSLSASSSRTDSSSGKKPGQRQSTATTPVLRATTTPFAALDPFESCAITITRQVEVLIHYHWQILATGYLVDKTEVLPRRLRPIRRYENVRDQSMVGLLQDKVRMTALLAAMAARMVHLSKITLAHVSPEQFILAALNALRRRMAAKEAEAPDAAFAIMQAIHSLAMAEVYRRRYDDALVHLNQLKGIVSSTKITSPSHSYIAEAMINIDGLISIETGRVPIMTYSFDPGPLTDRRSREIETQLSLARQQAPPVHRATIFPEEDPPSPMIYDAVDILADASTALDPRIGEGFSGALQQCDVVHPLLTPIVRDLLEVVQVAKLVWLTATARESDARWMCQRARVLTHRILALKSELSTPTTDPWLRRMEALRLALLLVMIRATSRVASRAAQVNVRLLMDSLRGQDLDWSNGNDAERSGGLHLSPVAPAPPREYLSSNYHQTCLLLFILLTGHFNALVSAETDQTWFLDQAVYVASQKLGLGTYRELDELMRRYLYNPVRQAVSLRLVAMYL